MDTFTIRTLIESLPIGGTFNFPPNTSREFIRSILRAHPLRSHRIDTMPLLKLHHSDKPVRITTITRLS